MRTEIEFTLPRGLVDGEGTVHREGTMRLATARDEIEPLREVEVRQNDAYLTILLLARTITRIGNVSDITPALVEDLYAADFDHLQRLYERINSDGEAVGVVSCPACAHQFEIDLTEIEDGRLGDDEAVSRGSARGDGPPRIPPPLAARHDHRPRTSGSAPVPG